MAYNLYYSPEGVSPSFCGEFDSLDDAMSAADADPQGLEQYLWETARAAGHVNGMAAPCTDGEDEESGESCGPNGLHFAVPRSCLSTPVPGPATADEVMSDAVVTAAALRREVVS